MNYGRSDARSDPGEIVFLHLYVLAWYHLNNLGDVGQIGNLPYVLPRNSERIPGVLGELEQKRRIIWKPSESLTLPTSFSKAH